jgi:hypothetical protein
MLCSDNIMLDVWNMSPIDGFGLGVRWQPIAIPSLVAAVASVQAKKKGQYVFTIERLLASCNFGGVCNVCLERRKQQLSDRTF